jgi:hypothetical protein
LDGCATKQDATGQTTRRALRGASSAIVPSELADTQYSNRAIFVPSLPPPQPNERTILLGLKDRGEVLLLGCFGFDDAER